MSVPIRIQRKRTAGWRMPENAVYVGRPTKWGNPFKAKDAEEVFGTPWLARDGVVMTFKSWLKAGDVPWWCGDSREQIHEQRKWILSYLTDLFGYDLVCWCPLDQPCHADVLLELANGEA